MKKPVGFVKHNATGRDLPVRWDPFDGKIEVQSLESDTVWEHLPYDRAKSVAEALQFAKKHINRFDQDK